MNIGESSELRAFRQSSRLRLSRVPTLEAMEGALAELRDLEWRAPSGGRSLAVSPWAKDGPWHLAQAAAGEDVAAGGAEYSETLITNAAGKELQVRKIDSLRPRTPLSMRETDRLEELRGWLELVPEALDREIIWSASFHLWRGEPMDWPRMKQRLGYPHSRERLGRRYREALCKLVCRVNGVPVRHYRALLARSGGAFADLLHR
jgi:hypothetical protein